MAVLSNVGFQDAPRNVDISGMVVVNTSGGSAAANEKLAGLVSTYELLQAQARSIVGTKIWNDKISPLL